MDYVLTVRINQGGRKMKKMMIVAMIGMLVWGCASYNVARQVKRNLGYSRSCVVCYPMTQEQLEQINKNWTLLREGMTMVEVIDLIGKPQTIFGHTSGDMIWTYTSHSALVSAFLWSGKRLDLYFDIKTLKLKSFHRMKW
jgi:hypothetical protein